MIVCIGSPIIDSVVSVDADFFIKYNLKLDSANGVDKSSGNLFEDLEKFNVKLVCGGSVTNTVRVLKWISKQRRVVYVGAIGADNYGDILKRKLIEENVICDFVVVDQPTGQCAVLIHESTRTLVTDLGASKYFSISHLKDKQIYQNVIDSKCIYFSGFFLGVSLDCVKEILNLRATLKKSVVFNLGAPFLFSKYPEEMLDIIRNVDVIFGNESELFALGNLLNLPIDNPSTLLTLICSYVGNNAIIVITRGENSVLTAKDNVLEEFPVGKVETIVDTNAAGDAFVGGFLAQFVEGFGIKDCVKCGIWAAGEVLKNVGCDFDKNKEYL